MQIGGKDIENPLNGVGKKKLKKDRFKKTHFHAFLFGNELNTFQFGIVQMITIGYGT